MEAFNEIQEGKQKSLFPFIVKEELYSNRNNLHGFPFSGMLTLIIPSQFFVFSESRHWAYLNVYHRCCWSLFHYQNGSLTAWHRSALVHGHFSLKHVEDTIKEIKNRPNTLAELSWRFKKNYVVWVKLSCPYLTYFVNNLNRPILEKQYLQVIGSGEKRILCAHDCMCAYMCDRAPRDLWIEPG